MNPADGRRLLEAFDRADKLRLIRLEPTRAEGDAFQAAISWLWEHREALVEAAERDAKAQTADDGAEEPEPIGDTCAECGDGSPAPGRSWCRDCIGKERYDY